ncbi:MAG: TIGR04211 family SH3 domain-containing protein [Gammaproteobacteria bacterium]|jgi:SH3 domain protein
MIDKLKFLLPVFITISSANLSAEVVYVTDQLQIGLHSEKNLDSPIIKIVASGTSLELIKTEEQLSFVREPDGIGGWIDSSYISSTRSASALLRTAESRIKTLEETINKSSPMTVETGGMEINISNDEIELLRQQLQQETLRANQLQTDMSGLVLQLELAGNPDSLYEKIDQLSAANREMEQQLANIIGGPPENLLNDIDATDTGRDWLTAKNAFISVLILLVIGIIAGMYIMDFINRKRHGGFRV